MKVKICHFDKKEVITPTNFQAVKPKRRKLNDVVHCLARRREYPSLRAFVYYSVDAFPGRRRAVRCVCSERS